MLGAAKVWFRRSQWVVRGIPQVSLCAVLAVSACGGGGGGSNVEDIIFPLTVPTDILVADIDGDGRADVMTLALYSRTSSEREGRLSVYRQSASGTFSAPDLYVVGTYPWHFALADIDGDGTVDLTVTDPDAHSVWLVRQDPGTRGRFLAAQKIASGVYPYGAAVGDFNDDGAPDVAISDGPTASARIVMLYQDPAQRGQFMAPVDLPMPGTVSDVVAGDLNGDGRTDLAAWVYTSGSGTSAPVGALAVTLQQPSGTFGAVTMLGSLTGLNVARLAIADYEGDGANDLLAYFTPYSSDYRATLGVARQSALPGTFTNVVATPLNGVSGLDDAVFADLNGDSRPDTAVAGFFPVGSPSQVHARVNLFTQSGGGAFAPTTVHDMPSSVSRIAAGDINGDGHPDLVTMASDQCLVMLQSATAPGTFADPKPLR